MGVPASRLVGIIQLRDTLCMCVCVCEGGGVTGGAQIYMLGAKCGFDHPRILLRKAWILASRKFPRIARSKIGSYLVLSATEYNLWYWQRRARGCSMERTYTGSRLSMNLHT